MIHDYTVTLPHPVGINATYRSGQGRWYKTARAKQWQRDALLLLRASGARPLPGGPYWLSLSLTLHTIRLDVDAPLKLAVDTVAAALGLDDGMVGLLIARKVPVRRRAEQRLELAVHVQRVEDSEGFGALTSGSVDRG